MNVARGVGEYLRAHGTRRVYGLPGEDHIHLLDGLAESGLEYVAARNESAACIMAGVEAQVTGVPGVAVISYAPGITNAINGLASAFLDRIPLLVFTGQFGRSRYPVTIRQAMNNHALVAPVTKWSTTAGSAIHQVLARARSIATTHPGGPVLIEIPQEIAEVDATDSLEQWRSGAIVDLRDRAKPPHDDVPLLREHLAGARRPVIIVGGGQHSTEVCALLDAFAQSHAMPVFTTPSAKGTFRLDQKWFAGTFVNGNLEADIVGKADLIVTVDLAANDIFNRQWPYKCAVIALGRKADTESFFPRVGEVRGPLAAAIGGVITSASASEWVAADVERYRESLRRSLRVGTSKFTIGNAVLKAREVLPRETSVVLDAGFSKVQIALLWDSLCPNGFFASHGLSTMGYAIPAATALKLNQPDRVVVAFTGDGSLLMRAPELGVAADLRVAPIYVVWIDELLTQIAVKQRRMGLREVGVRLSEVSAERVAAAFGGVGRDVASLEDFAEAIHEATRADCPVLIGAHVDSSDHGELYEIVRG